MDFPKYTLYWPEKWEKIKKSLEYLRKRSWSMYVVKDVVCNGEGGEIGTD